LFVKVAAPQLSVAVGGVKVTPVATHEALAEAITGTGAVTNGGVRSCTTTVWFTVTLLPFASVNVHGMVYVPWFKYVNGLAVVPVIVPEQLSCIVGGVTVTEQEPLTVGREVTTGAELSATVTVNEQLEVFPDASVAVYVTVVVPTLNVDPEAWLEDKITPGQLSDPVGSTQLTTAEQLAVAVETEILVGQLVITGD